VKQLKLEAESLSDLKSVIDVQPQVLVVFTQPATCIPCKRLYPHLVKYAEKHTSPTIVTVDLDKVPEAMVEYDLRSVPTLHLYEQGNFSRVVIGRTVVQLEKELD
jgi:thiol-disulfide isomerase/thioredoxin